METIAGGGIWIPTGSDILNLALSNRVDGGYASGRITNIIGDTHAGKSILALTGLAEMAENPIYDNYLLLYQDCEWAQAFDIRNMFGDKLHDRLQEAWHEEGGANYEPPDTIQEWYKRSLQRIASGRPYCSILDSFDALATKEEIDKSDAIANETKQKGSMGMEKARYASEYFRVLAKGLSKTGSLEIIVSQTRDNVDPIGFQNKTRAGGKALEFYASYIFWLYKLTNITKGSEEKKVTIGRNVEARVTKTKSTGWSGKVKFPVYRQIGIDNIGSSVDFLLQWSDKWRKSKNSIVCNELGLQGLASNVYNEIENNNYQGHIKEHLQEAWNAYLEHALIDRKPRFASNNGGD